MGIAVERAERQLAELEADIKRMQSEKDKIMDWVKKQEQAVDKAKAELVKIQEKMIDEQKSLDSKIKESNALIEQVKGERNKLEEQRRSVNEQLVRLSEAKAEDMATSNRLREEQERLKDLGADLSKKANFIEHIFSEIEKLKNG